MCGWVGEPRVRLTTKNDNAPNLKINVRYVLTDSVRPVSRRRTRRWSRRFGRYRPFAGFFRDRRRRIKLPREKRYGHTRPISFFRRRTEFVIDYYYYYYYYYVDTARDSFPSTNFGRFIRSVVSVGFDRQYVLTRFRFRNKVVPNGHAAHGPKTKIRRWRAVGTANVVWYGHTIETKPFRPFYSEIRNVVASQMCPHRRRRRRCF